MAAWRWRLLLTLASVPLVLASVSVGAELELLGAAWSGGWPMTNVRAARNDARDFKGDYTYYFCLGPRSTAPAGGSPSSQICLTARRRGGRLRE